MFVFSRVSPCHAEISYNELQQVKVFKLDVEWLPNCCIETLASPEQSKTNKNKHAITNKKSKCSNDPYSHYLQEFFTVSSLT